MLLLLFWLVFYLLLTLSFCIFLIRLGLLKYGPLKLLVSKIIAWDSSRVSKIRNENKEIKELYREHFSSMEDIIKRVGGPVLELGAGNGLNIEFYPKNTELLTVDLNETFRKYFDENMAKNPHVKLVKYMVGNSENLEGLVDDNSCSCVISSLLLCCADQQKTLAEVMRVLKPGGRFYFMDHIIGEKGTWLRFVQETISDTWAEIRHNCTLTRNTDEVIQQFGFHNLNARIVNRPLPFMYSFARRTYIGFADKPV